MVFASLTIKQFAACILSNSIVLECMFKALSRRENLKSIYL